MHAPTHACTLVQVPEPADVVALSGEFDARLAELLAGLQELHASLMKRDSVSQVNTAQVGGCSAAACPEALHGCVCGMLGPVCLSQVYVCVLTVVRAL